MNYKRLGNYIELIDVRNTDLSVDKLLGLTIDKKFIPSVANTIGTNMKRYKIIRRNQFACSTMQVRRDGKMPIAILKDYDEAIISQAYPVFKVIDEQVLNPDYLMMWFTRQEFDRQATFHAVGGVRGSIEWVDFLDFELPIPSIEKQRKIVAEYQAVENKIKTNEQICEKLEAAAQALYKHWFVDFEFPNEEDLPYKSSGGAMVYNEELEKEIPKGWEVIKIKNFCIEMKNGATPSRSNLNYWNSKDIPWLKTGEVSNNVIFDTEEYISEKGYKNSSTKLIPKDSVLMAMYGATAGQLAYLKKEVTTNQACCAMISSNKKRSAFLYYALLNQQKRIETMAIGGAQPNLSKLIVENLSLVIPENLDDLIENKFSGIIDLKAAKTLENIKLVQFQSLLLARITREKDVVTDIIP